MSAFGMASRSRISGSVRDVISDYWRHTARYPLLVTLLILVGAAIQAAVVIAPLYLKDFIDIIATNAPSTAIEGLTTALALFALFIFIAWGLRRLQFYFIAALETRVMADLNITSFSYIIRHSYHFFVSNFVGAIVRRITRYSRSYETVADAIFFQLYPVILIAFGMVAILYLRHPALGIGLAVWIVVFSTIQIALIRRIHPYRLKAAEEDSNVTGVLSDALSNQSTATLFAGLAHEHARFETAVSRFRTAQYRSWKFDDNIWAIQGLLIAIVNVVLLFAAMRLWQQGLLSVGDFVLIQTYLLTLFERLVQAGREVRQVFSAVAEATETAEMLRIPHEVRDVPDAVPLFVKRGEIVFKDIRFGYRDGNAVLSRFDVRVAGGEKVALVGPSGAGKTTVTKLLLRLYDLDEGVIEIDGQDIGQATLESLRKSIAFVPQDPVLFHRTLLENIRYGDMGASEHEVIEAAKKAHCHEFISALPHGYETLVGERGIKLSGGERQRIAIARAILKNAPILVLDEATSSLDSESEALIQDALETLMKAKTVIVIAHRLSTVIKMDRIIVMEDGRVTAEGRHEELIKQGGKYQTLWNIQAGGFLDSEDIESEDV
ncbi:ABC transporter ATP-binding protein [Candidatus Parcubacteria bacterium]|nr:MAG: ABC transporter ATP-binding protein [Candidatus Parcubacteria bacterium]